MPLSPAQETIVKDDSRFRVAVTGRRFGKTHVAMRELAKHASKPNQQVWYVAPSYRMSQGYCLGSVQSKIKRLTLD